jgi:hypothetical protein
LKEEVGNAVIETEQKRKTLCGEGRVSDFEREREREKGKERKKDKERERERG